MVLFFIFLIVLALFVSVAWAVIGIYNRLVFLKQNLENGMAQIDVQLKRRHDLIGNLVETVKGYATHENKTLKEVIQARNTAVSASTVKEKANAENMLTAALSRLLVTVESYPQLKADKLFIDLQDELTSTENKISLTRESYNQQVAVFNTSIKVFPTNMIVSYLGFSEGEYLKINETEKQVPQVKF